MLPAAEALDRRHLNFFLAGPGPGEGLALALPEPEGGWIFIDGCKTAASAVEAGSGALRGHPREKQQYPLLEIWKRYRRDTELVQGIVLTHPHQDHYAGMVDMIDLTSPKWLACVATHHRAEVQAHRDDPVIEEYPGLLIGPVKDLLGRIQGEWDWKRKGRVILRAGERLPLDRSDVLIDVVAPDGDGTRAFFRDAGFEKRIRKHANEISAVLHVRYGSTRLLLGGDLPESDRGVGPRTGWTKVLASYPDVPGSLIFKIPHHASDGAMHPRMVGRDVAPPGARWAVTPFHGGLERPVPKLNNGKGIEALLGSIAQVHLTSLPTGWSTTEDRAKPVPLDGIAPEAAPRLPMARNVTLRGSTPCDALDAVWLFTIDAAGNCLTEYRGDRALIIVPRKAPAQKTSAQEAPARKPASRGAQKTTARRRPGPR